MVHCACAQPEIVRFFSLSQNIYMVGISKKSDAPQGMFILLSKSENRGISFTHVHCADHKYFGKLTLCLQVFNGASLKKISDFEFH